MKRVLFLCLAAGALMHASCSKDNTPPDTQAPQDTIPHDTIPHDTMYYVRSIKNLVYNDSLVFNYNDEMQLRRHAYYSSYSNTVFYLRYDNGRLSSINQAGSASDTIGSTRVLVVYNSAGKLTRFVNGPDPNDPDLSFDSLILNSAGRLAKLYRYSSASRKYLTIRTFYWEGDNVVKVEDTVSNALQATFTYKYDNKRNLYAPLSPMVYISDVYYQDYHYLSANNVTEFKWFNAGKLIGSRNYDYTYNDKGYPVKMKESRTSYAVPQSTIVDSSAISYIVK